MGDQLRRKLTVLFITPMFPDPANSGGLQVTRERIRELATFTDVTVVAIGEGSISSSAACELGVKDAWSGGALRPRNPINYLLSWFRGVPLSIWRNMSPGFMSIVKDLRKTHWDYVYVDHWLVWPAARWFQASKRVLHLHNAEHLLFSRAAQNYPFFVRLALTVEAKRVASYLRRVCAQSDEVHYLSESDRLESRAIGCNTYDHVFHPSVAIQSLRHGCFGERILFAGTLSWQPNEEGLRWFLAEVRPLLPDTAIVEIVGGEPNSQLLEISSRVEHCPVLWHGRVPEVDPYYRRASVFAAPLLSGSGIKIKILNALAYGLPVVTTSTGIEGFPTDWGSAIRVADSPEDFAEAIRELTADRETWLRACEDAQPYILRHFSGLEFSRWCAQLGKR
jgi:polysaccharide biosynthesis protein PslH